MSQHENALYHSSLALDAPPAKPRTTSAAKQPGARTSRNSSQHELRNSFMEPFSFAPSPLLKVPVSIKIVSLDGQTRPIPFSTLLKRPDLKHQGSNQSPYSELFVTVQAWADGYPLTIPTRTAYKPFRANRVWNEWISLPITYSNLPQSACIAITVWDLCPAKSDSADDHVIPFAGTTIPLFDDENLLQKGRQRCCLHRHRVADGLANTKTPHVPSSLAASKAQNRRYEKIPATTERESEIVRLEALMKRREMGEIPENRWLDQLVFRQIEKLNRDAINSSRKSPGVSGVNFDSAQEKSGATATHPRSRGQDGAAEEDEGLFLLYVEFPRFDHPVVFADHEYPAPPISTLMHQQTPSSSLVRGKPLPELQLDPGINTTDEAYGDANAGRLVRIFDPETGIKDNPAESKHRILVRSHRSGVLDRDLKPNAIIRDELHTIMSYDPTHNLTSDEKNLVWKFRYHLTKDKRALTKFLKSVLWSNAGEARQAVQILPIWSQINVDDALELLSAKFENPSVRAYAVERLRKSDDEDLLNYLLQLVQALKFEGMASKDEAVAQDSSLANFLIARAASNMILGNYLHWFLMVECDDSGAEQTQDHRRLFARVEYDFMTQLVHKSGGSEARDMLLRQGELVTVLSKISKDIRFSREDRPRKIERLKQFLADPANDLIKIDPPLPLPLDPSILIVGCYPEEASVFKSSLFPLLIPFKTADGRKYPLIFKTGDDLRQDQLVIQIIRLMDNLLQKENLDLKLSPYHILATSTSAGMVQFVESKTLDAACKKYKGSLLAYLRANNPDENGPLGVRKESMDTYVKSCAGYCVITYLLGVGDRHLDNLLLAPDGHFFHADFGYILGRDPKPFAPLMKLSKEMIEGMGGDASPHYQAFKQHCFTAYTTLRKSSNLILNLFALMIDANIPDIRIEPEKAVLKVKERFHLSLSEEEAIRHFESLIQDSVTAFFPVVIDRLHGLVQQWRA